MSLLFKWFYWALRVGTENQWVSLTQGSAQSSEHGDESCDAPRVERVLVCLEASVVVE